MNVTLASWLLAGALLTVALAMLGVDPDDPRDWQMMLALAGLGVAVTLAAWFLWTLTA